jgi:GR25 family glycosyltransferase involved in LPS biosynthesis
VVGRRWHIPCDPHGMGRGNVGCTMTHNAILKHILEQRYRLVMVFEDDVELCDNFIEQLTTLINNIPHNCQMLYLGANHQIPMLPLVGNKVLGKVVRAYTTHAYIITAAAASALYTESQKVDAPIDVAYARVHPFIGCYAPYNNIAFQRGGYSDIQERVTNYDFMKNRGNG